VGFNSAFKVGNWWMCRLQNRRHGSKQLLAELKDPKLTGSSLTRDLGIAITVVIRQLRTATSSKYGGPGFKPRPGDGLY
jgi:hypothetical protein